MVMVWHLLKRDLSHKSMRILKCSGSLFLLLWWCVLATYLLNLVRKLTQASGAWRGRSRCALPLLFLLFFSSFSFASSSLSGFSAGYNYSSPGPESSGCVSSPSAACAATGGVPNSSTCGSNACLHPSGSGYGAFCYAYSSCSSSCSPPSGVPIAGIGSSLTPNSSGVLPGTYCDPSDDCDTENVLDISNGQLQSAGTLTNGDSCFPSAPTSSASLSNSGTSCPSGYSFGDNSGCFCINSSGDSIPASGSSGVSACNGGSSTAPTLTPVAPVDSNGVESCPSGSDSISSSSGSLSCVVSSHLPKVSSASSGSVSNDGGSGGSSSFHDVPPVTNSSGQTVCPSGSSSLSGTYGAGLTCVASGSASGSGSSPTSSTGSSTSPTSSTGSSTSPTSSTGSSAYPSSVSMPTLASSSVVSTALGTIGTINETSSETCPSPITFSLMNTTFSIPFTYACSLAADVRPIVIGVFSLASILLIVK